MQRMKITIMGTEYKNGTKDGKPWEICKIHFSYESQWVNGKAVACANCSPDDLVKAGKRVGTECDAIVSFYKYQCSGVAIV